MSAAISLRGRATLACLCVAVLVPALVALPEVAHAADGAVADRLFEEAKALMEAGDVRSACSKFEASYEADPGLGALLNLADCLERDGRLASAFGRWTEAFEVAGRRTDARATYASERREALRPRLSFVTLEVTGKADDLTVLRGSTKISPGAFGTALPTDPGKVSVQVARGDDVVWERVVSVEESQSTKVAIDLSAISAANPPPMKKVATETAVARAPGATDEDYSGRFWSTQRIAGAVVGSTGIAGGIAAAVLGGLAASAASGIDAECVTTSTPVCTQEGRKLVDRSGTLADASTWTFVGSGIVTVVGLTVFFTAPWDAELTERASIEPWIEVGPSSVHAGLRF
jgi:hypothetical protein